MPNGAPQHAAQDISPPFITRNDAVGQEETDRPQMIGDHAHRDVAVHRAAVPPAREGGDPLEDRLKEVGVVVRVDALQHRGHSFEPGTGVDRRPGQGRQVPTGVTVELHEHQVPDLEVAAALGTLVPGDGRQPRRAIDVDLAARPAGPGLAHRPEVVALVAPHDALGRQAGDLAPESCRLVVLAEDAGVEAARVETPGLGRQLPSELDRLCLEVVAEREVAQHLEEGVVARAGPHVLEVVVLARDPHALLHRHGARRRRRAATEEGVLELHHAGVGEQQRRVAVRHQRRARQVTMPALGEEVDEALADVGARHDSESRSGAARRNRSTISRMTDVENPLRSR